MKCWSSSLSNMAVKRDAPKAAPLNFTLEAKEIVWPDLYK
jgi:hypothetical protein